jgi:hypothetical protein
VTGQSGAVCPESGPYRSNTTSQVVVFVRRGDTFPPGPDGNPTTWMLVTIGTD